MHWKGATQRVGEKSKWIYRVSRSPTGRIMVWDDGKGGKLEEPGAHHHTVGLRMVADMTFASCGKHGGGRGITVRVPQPASTRPHEAVVACAAHSPYCRGWGSPARVSSV